MPYRPTRALLLPLVALLAGLASPVRCLKINISVEECFTEHVAEAHTTIAGSFVAIPPKGLTATQREYDLTVRGPSARVAGGWGGESPYVIEQK